MARQAEPRRHHYVPRCWLCGFTDTSTQEGKLVVTDLIRKNQWVTKPANVGFARDFYRLTDERISDPVLVEKALSRIESEIAPILRLMDEEHRGPTVEELEPLLYFIAIQWTRVPAFRPFILDVIDAVSYERLSEYLKSPKTWERALRKAGIPSDAPGAEYDRMKEFYAAKAYTLSAPTDWYMKRAFKAAEDVLPSLRKRLWSTFISPTGSFIASDSPVVLEGPRDVKVGFENAELITYVVSRHVTLWGTLWPIQRPLVNRKFIAKMNTLSLLQCEEQVFSNVPAFCWMDENSKYQTDWKKFSKDRY